MTPDPFSSAAQATITHLRRRRLLYLFRFTTKSFLIHMDRVLPSIRASAQAQFLKKPQIMTEDIRSSDLVRSLLYIPVAGIIHECRRKAFETERPPGHLARKANVGVRAIRRKGRTRKAPPGERTCSTRCELRPQSPTGKGGDPVSLLLRH